MSVMPDHPTRQNTVRVVRTQCVILKIQDAFREIKNHDEYEQFVTTSLVCNRDTNMRPILIADDKKLNVVFILADDLGWGELGCYGQAKIPTPNLDRLALQGVRFTQHYSGAPVCAPSRCVLMTGKHLGHAEVRGNLQAKVNFPEFTEGQTPLSENCGNDCAAVSASWICNWSDG